MTSLNNHLSFWILEALLRCYWRAMKVTVLEWLPQMTCQKLRADMVAGLTVGVMVIPQSMSYGAIAGSLGCSGQSDRNTMEKQ